MTQLEYLNIIRAIETVEDNEKIHCKRFIELNPAAKEERERDRDLILYGLMRARFEIEERYNKMKTTNNTRDKLINILSSYKRMIERNKDFPGVLIDDLEKSIDFVLKENKRM